MRPSCLRTFPAWALLLALGCGQESSPSPIALRDPLGLADVTQELRLTVFPSTERSCEGDGSLNPALPDDPSTDLPDATVDRRFAVDELQQEVVVEAGSYVIAVQGWGTDPVTMRTNVLVTRGCATDMIEAGQERPVTLMLQDIQGMGVCADELLSPDEQCEPASGPFPCDADTCRTTETVGNTTSDGTQDAPAVAWSAGGRMVVAFQNGATELRWNFLDQNGATIMSPAALQFDAALDEGVTLAGVQTSPGVAVSPARVAATFHDLSTATTEGGDVYVRFFTADRAPESGNVLVVPSPGEQRRPQLALATDGAALIVFSDSSSSTGASAAFVPAGATTPASTFPIGNAGATSPSVASNGSGFIVVWVEGGVVQAQRYGTDGSATDAMPIAVSESPTPAVPAVSLMADGRAYVAWGSGSGVRGRAIDASGTPGQANDLAGAGARPRVATGGGRFFAVWEDAGTIMARYIDGNGQLADNREQPRTSGAFTVGSGSAPDVAAGATGDQPAALVSWASPTGNIALRTFALP